MASLQRKLKSLEKERKDVLVRLADATKGRFLALFGPDVNSSKEHFFQFNIPNCILLNKEEKML